MKRHLLMAALVLLALPAWATKPVTKALTLPAYTAIEVEDAVSVVMSADVASPYLSAQPECIESVVCQVHKGTLHVGLRPGATCQGRRRPTLYLPANPSLRKVELEGASRFEGRLTQPHFKLEAEGASSATLTCDVGMLDVDADGASSVILRGTCTSLKLEVEGTSHVNASALEAEAVAVEVEGASSVEVWATDRLVGQVTSASRLRYRGNPKVAVARTGASSVEPM